MGRGRWSEDNEGWRSRRTRSTSRNNERKRDDKTDPSKQLKATRQENQRLQQQIRELQRGKGQPNSNHHADVAVSGPRPLAKEGPDRHGDWICAHCLFRTNRHGRSNCYRCAVSKSFSFSANATAISGGGGAGDGVCFNPIPGTTTTTTTSTSPSTSPSPPSLAPSPSSMPTLASGAPLLSSVSVPSSTSQSVNMVSGPAQQPLCGPEAIKALKSQLDTLLAVKAQFTNNPLCGHLSATMGIDAQINGVRTQLASAQPLEVALRGTLGPVSQARAALQRAEAKVTKLESQVVTAVAAYEAAMADVQACQKQLAEAEATIARTAGGRFDPRMLIGAHPGAALTILSEAAAARCVLGAPGVNEALVARVQASFNEVQAACRLLPADVPVASPTSAQAAGSGDGQQQASGQSPSPGMPSGETVSGGISGTFPGNASNGMVGPTGTATQDAAHTSQQLLLQQHILQQQVAQQHVEQHQAGGAQAQPPSGSDAAPGHPAAPQSASEQPRDPAQLAAQQHAQLVAAELARQHSQALLVQAAQVVTSNAGTVPGVSPAAPVAEGQPVPAQTSSDQNAPAEPATIKGPLDGGTTRSDAMVGDATG